MIGWESDNNTVGPIAVAAKQSLLRLIPHIMPADSDDEQISLYRLVSRTRRFWHSQHVNYKRQREKRQAPRDLPVRLGDWVHHAGYLARPIDGGDRRSGGR